jgi:pilus assembly protein Flp/PilA
LYNTHHGAEETRMMELAKRFWNDESGQGLAEYALLLGLIVVGVVILIQGMGVSIKNIFGRANSELKSAATPPAP